LIPIHATPVKDLICCTEKSFGHIRETQGTLLPGLTGNEDGRDALKNPTVFLSDTHSWGSAASLSRTEKGTYLA
jgi:hypothetical protein